MHCNNHAFFTIGVSDQQPFIPSTVSQETGEVIKALSSDNLPAGTKEEWKSAWEATEEAFRPINDQARENYPAEIETLNVEGIEHLLVTSDNYDPQNASSFKYFVTLKDGSYGFNLFDLCFITLKGISIQNHHIRVLSHLNRSGYIFNTHGIGSV